MKFTEKWKKFWTLDRKRADGFTLIELIVVIAILAILGGVAVPAYSGYVKKANMTADIALVSDVKQALELAGYSGELKQAGYVLLSEEAGVASGGDDGEIAKALEKTFGTNWKDAVKLKWDGWDASADAMNAGLVLTEEQAKAVGASNYLTNSDVGGLLGNVQKVTSAASEFLGNITKTEEGYLSALETALEGGYMSAAKEAGLVTENNGTYAMADGMYKDGKLTEEAQNQFSNLMVMSVAKEMEKMSDQELINTVINVSNPSGSVDGTGSIGNQLAVTYSMILAYELSNGGEPSDDFNTLNNSLHSNSLSAIQGAFQTYLASSKTGGNGFLNYAVSFDGSGNPTTLKDGAKTDFTALTSIMSGVNAVSDKYTNKDSLADGGLMTSGGVANDVNAFVGAAAMKASGIDTSLLGSHTGPFVYFAPDAGKLFVVGSSVG